MRCTITEKHGKTQITVSALTIEDVQDQVTKCLLNGRPLTIRDDDRLIIVPFQILSNSIVDVEKD